MDSRLPVIDDDGEVGDLSKVDMSLFRPAAEVLDPALYANLIAMNAAAISRKRGERGAQKHPVKVPTTIRFDADILEALKASGKGWQTRVNEAVRDWLKTHSAV
jgi:uncharacterized protein (DUF4415 family)